MVDSVAHLDLIDAAAEQRRAPVRIFCIDVDAGWRVAAGGCTVGAKRSPLHDPARSVELAREVVARPGFELDGLMAYEAADRRGRRPAAGEP